MAATKILGCLFCKTHTTVDRGTRAVLCEKCVSKLAGAPQMFKPKAPKLTKAGIPRKRRGTAVKKVPSGRPRGWHFKVFYRDSDGSVFSRGQLITDTKLIKKLETQNV